MEQKEILGFFKINKIRVRNDGKRNDFVDIELLLMAPKNWSQTWKDIAVQKLS